MDLFLLQPQTDSLGLQGRAELLVASSKQVLLLDAPNECNLSFNELL